MQHLIITRTLKNPTGTLQLTAIPLEPLNKIGEKPKPTNVPLAGSIRRKWSMKLRNCNLKDKVVL